MINTLGFSGRQVGLVYANTAIAASVSPMLLGYLADKYFSVEKLLTISHFLGAILLFSVPFIENFTIFFWVTFLYLLLYLPSFSLTNSLCFHHVKDAKKDFPKIRVWGTISWIVAGLVVSFLGIEMKSTTFFIAAGFSLLLSIYTLTLPPTPPSKDASLGFWKTVKSPEILTLIKDRSFTVMLISIALIGIPCAYYYSFVNPFLIEMNVTNSAGKMAIGQVSEILLLLALPWFLKNWNLRIIIFIGLLVWGIRYGMFILGMNTETETWYMVGLVVHGIAYIFGMVAAQIYMDIKVPSHLRSTAQGFFSFLTLGLSAYIGNYIAGETVSMYTLADGSHEWQSIWLFPFIFGSVTAVLFLLFFKGIDDTVVE